MNANRKTDILVRKIKNSFKRTSLEILELYQEIKNSPGELNSNMEMKEESERKDR